MSVTEPIQIPIEGNATDFIADAKKVQAEMDAMSAKLKAAGVSQSAYNKAVANSKVAVTQNTTAVKQSAISITDLRSAYMIAADAARVAGQVWQATGQEFVNYAEQVKNMSRSLGASAEETSRLIQVADDVRISYDSLKIAMKEAQKDGIAPNIEGLAKLADQYVAIQDPAEKTKFLLDKFGKSGLEMGKLMEKGGDGVREMSGAIDDSLIMTEKGIKASDDYQIALDNWNDSIQAVKISIGNDLLPVMTDLLDHTSLNTRALEIMEEQGLSTYHAMGTVGYAAAYKMASEELELSKATNKATTAFDDNSNAAGDNADAIDAQKEAVKAAEDALKDYKDMLDQVSQTNKDMESTSRKIAEDQRQYEDDHAEALEKRKEAEENLLLVTHQQGDGSREQQRALEDVRFAQKDLNEAIKEYGKNSEEATMARRKLEDAMENTSAGGEAMLEAENSLRDAQAAVTDLEATWLNARVNMVYDMILVGLAVDGLTESERKAADDYAIAKGIKTQADVDEANARIDEAQTVVDGIELTEDAMVENKKIAEEKKRLETAISAEEAIAAGLAQAEAMGVVVETVDSATQSYIAMAKAAWDAAAAAQSAAGSSGGSSSGSGGGAKRDSGGFGIAGVEYMIGTGAQPEKFTPATNGYFTPNAKSGGTTTTIINITNPKREAAEDSVRKTMRKLQYTRAAA